MRFAIPGVNSDDCWAWSGAKNENGYGRVRLSRKLEVKAHRLSYAIHYGVDPGPLDVCNKCDNPECTNPKHLWVGSHAENIKDATGKGRWIGKGKGVPHDHTNHPSNKLTPSQVSEILERYAVGDVTQKALAKEYGVSRVAITNIMTGRRHGKVLVRPSIRAAVEARLRRDAKHLQRAASAISERLK